MPEFEGKRVEETIMQYTEYVYWDGDEVVATERMEDDSAYDVRSTREPTSDEITDYYGEQVGEG
ncbi:hypothetical protein [Microbacterium sp. No. 7]|uniref:hypothetical protein n=1 Tax=Microbacterium sp. No. 7 TaxID=1714373 RepID=UPI0006D0E116|nr:hypothetical protein [Microbacterium sp. No. 7]ALJ22068.1 hypothetical protein AOA12_20115 [Microbacterium sp. No. 7]